MYDTNDSQHTFVYNVQILSHSTAWSKKRSSVFNYHVFNCPTCDTL